MTVKELKDYYFKHLHINLKTKKQVSDDYEVTTEDIEKGNIFQKYISGDTLTKIVNGFTVMENKIYYVYTRVHRIEILTDDFFPPCGGENEVMVNAAYSIRALSTFNDDILVSGNGTLLSPVNALVTIDNPIFAYDKPYIINKNPNNSDINNVVNIDASYYYKGVKHVATKQVIQHINTNSSWLVEEEPTQFISLSFDKNVVSNKGGIVTAKVERYFSRIYYMKDSCGNKIGGKSEPGLVEDITNKCLITSSNRNLFRVNKNIITVPKQDVGALKREFKVTARYLDKTATETITQAEGGKITYTQELSFVDGTKNKFIDLETSTPSEFKLPIISREYKYVDGEYDSVSDTNEIKVTSDSDWVNGVQGEDENGVNIFIRVTETNTDRENDREAVLTIRSTENPDLILKLVISQPSLSLVKTEYFCESSGGGEYTSDEINNAEIYFHPYKVLTYEDGEKETFEIDEYVTVKNSFKSSDEKLINVSSVNKKGNAYYLNFNNISKYSMKNINITGKLYFYGLNKEKLTESNTVNIIIKGNQIVDYNYELCFDGHNKFKELVWTNSSEPKFIKVNSLKHKLVNGKNAGQEPQPFKVGIYENGKEIFDDSFSIKIISDEIVVFPAKTNKSLEREYIVTQKETHEKISFKLIYKKKNTSYEIPLKVIVYSNNVGSDIWTGENGYLLIDDNITVKLNPCWLSPNMKDNVDVSYSGVIELEEGKHIFETFNVIQLNHDKTHKDCNIYNEINVDKTTKNIIIRIKI